MRDVNLKSRLAYDKKAAIYDKTLEGRLAKCFQKKLLEVIHVGTNELVLDVGCGDGTFLAELNRKSAIQGIGIDISSKMIQQAKHKNPSLEFYTANCESIPFGEKTFQCITACVTFHHFPNPKAFAKEAQRLLVLGGKLYVCEIYLPALIRFIVNPFLPLYNAGDVKIYSTKEICRVFEDQNFECEIIKVQGCIQIIELRCKGK